MSGPDLGDDGPYAEAMTTPVTDGHIPEDRLEALNARAALAARLMKLLASEQRLRILCRLGEGEASVTELAHYADLAQTAASQHLAKLRAEGIVAARRDGQTIFYRLVDPAAVRMIGALCEVFGPS